MMDHSYLKVFPSGVHSSNVGDIIINLRTRPRQTSTMSFQEVISDPRVVEVLVALLVQVLQPVPVIVQVHFQLFNSVQLSEQLIACTTKLDIFLHLDLFSKKPGKELVHPVDMGLQRSHDLVDPLLLQDDLRQETFPVVVEIDQVFLNVGESVLAGHLTGG